MTNQTTNSIFLKVLCRWKNFFFDMPIKNDEEKFEQSIEMGRNNDYATGNLLGNEYFSKHYKLMQ